MHPHNPQHKENVSDRMRDQHGSPGHLVEVTSRLPSGHDHQEAELDDDKEEEQSRQQHRYTVGYARDRQPADPGRRMGADCRSQA